MSVVSFSAQGVAGIYFYRRIRLGDSNHSPYNLALFVEKHAPTHFSQASLTFRKPVMHTAQMLAQAIDAARRLGYEIREDALEGAGGGHYIIRGKRCLMIDMTQSYGEQLGDVLDALRAAPNLSSIQIHPALAERLAPPQSNAA